MYILGREVTITWEILATNNPPALGDLDLLLVNPKGEETYEVSPAQAEDYTEPTSTTNGKLIHRRTPDRDGLWKIRLVTGTPDNYQILARAEMYVFKVGASGGFLGQAGWSRPPANLNAITGVLTDRCRIDTGRASEYTAWSVEVEDPVGSVNGEKGYMRPYRDGLNTYPLYEDFIQHPKTVELYGERLFSVGAEIDNENGQALMVMFDENANEGVHTVNHRDSFGLANEVYWVPNVQRLMGIFSQLDDPVDPGTCTFHVALRGSKTLPLKADTAYRIKCQVACVTRRTLDIDYPEKAEFSLTQASGSSDNIKLVSGSWTKQITVVNGAQYNGNDLDGYHLTDIEIVIQTEKVSITDFILSKNPDSKAYNGAIESLLEITTGHLYANNLLSRVSAEQQTIEQFRVQQGLDWSIVFDITEAGTNLRKGAVAIPSKTTGTGETAIWESSYDNLKFHYEDGTSQLTIVADTETFQENSGEFIIQHTPLLNINISPDDSGSEWQFVSGNGKEYEASADIAVVADSADLKFSAEIKFVPSGGASATSTKVDYYVDEAADPRPAGTNNAIAMIDSSTVYKTLKASGSGFWGTVVPVVYIWVDENSYVIDSLHNFPFQVAIKNLAVKEVLDVGVAEPGVLVPEFKLVLPYMGSSAVSEEKVGLNNHDFVTVFQNFTYCEDGPI